MVTPTPHRVPRLTECFFFLVWEKDDGGGACRKAVIARASGKPKSQKADGNMGEVS